MKVIPQYKVIGPYNYDRIMHNIEKKYAKRQEADKFEYAFYFKNKNVCNSLK